MPSGERGWVRENCRRPHRVVQFKSRVPDAIDPGSAMHAGPSGRMRNARSMTMAWVVILQHNRSLQRLRARGVPSLCISPDRCRQPRQSHHSLLAAPDRTLRHGHPWPPLALNSGQMLGPPRGYRVGKLREGPALKVHVFYLNVARRTRRAF